MSVLQSAGMALLSAIAGLGTLAAQPFYFNPNRAEVPATIRLDTNLVLVPVTVTDSRGRLVSNLAAADFTVLEDRLPQDLVAFSHENEPISLGMVVDLSGSMANKIREVRTAAQELLDRLEPEDDAFLVTFADTPELRLPLTSDLAAVRSALAFSEPGGSTSLFDAVALATRQMRRARNRRKVLFLVSDGGDNHSHLTERELRHVLEEEDIQIHAVGLHDGSGGLDVARGSGILDDLADMTGGQHYIVRDISQLRDLAVRMSLTLHDRYVLGYRPTPPGPSGVSRRIEVKVAQPKGTPRLLVYARRLYRMP